MGEAGIGKSRLVQHFREQIAEIPHAWIEAASAPFFQNTPFYPISELLWELVGRGPLPGNDGVHNSAEPLNDKPLARLEFALRSAQLNPDEALPLVAPLLNLSVPEKYPSQTLVPEEQRRRLLATLLEWMLGAAQVQPVAILIEDLHWADPSTVELIRLLVERAATAHLLLLCTARPELHQQWSLRSHHTQIKLNRLSARNVREMIAQVATRSALANEAIDAMIERTGGVPLFVEELTRAVLESGRAKLATRDIPVTLNDSLMARLDLLGPAKEVLQIGAVIGSEFSYELLHAVHPIAQQDLEAALGSAADAELVYVRGIAPDSTYQFKHALVRDAAHEALLKSRRKELHQRVARVIDEKFPILKEGHPELLARHWAEAGETEPAMAQWKLAGKAAESRAAFKEAEESYEQALALINQLPESRDRDLHELELQTSISLTSYYLRADANESINAAERAVALSQKSGNLKQLADSTGYRWFLARTSGDIRLSSALADQTLEVARREGSAASLSFAQIAQFIVRYDLGDLGGAEKHFAAAQKFFEDPGYRRFMFPIIGLAFAHASMNAWILGRIGAAREHEARMMVTVDKNKPLAMAACTQYAAIIRTLIRDHAEAQRLAAEAVDLCEKISFAQGAAASRCVLGYERTLLHHAAEGPALIRNGIAAMDAMASRSGLGALTALLAEALAHQGSLPEALDTIEQALRVNPAELTFRPELLRVRGELRLRLRRRDEAEGDFREAITMAVGMSAKSWELRATMSLARLRAFEGRRDEARAMLAEIYNWFTEGFDTADLKDAKVLLDELKT
jgi:tetratricopeptide (TPR) repeat protein